MLSAVAPPVGGPCLPVLWAFVDPPNTHPPAWGLLSVSPEASGRVLYIAVSARLERMASSRIHC